MGIIWKGVDGTLYDFTEHRYDSDWADIGGIFIFAARLPSGDWNPLYVGNAESLAKRIRGNEKWPWAERLGANGVLACAVEDEVRRGKIVAEMIARLKPPFNDYPQPRLDETPMRRAGGG
ncbi:MAG TPA: hypothetical protein VFB32_09485 [Rudaea sp.]|nr:hypothetical protein [Rudaea sp.]